MADASAAPEDGDTVPPPTEIPARARTRTPAADIGRPGDVDPDRDRRAREVTRRTMARAHRRLADELLPALIARLSASSLGELEIREASWRIRLRRRRRHPAGGAAPARAGTFDGVRRTAHRRQGRGHCDGTAGRRVRQRP